MHTITQLLQAQWMSVSISELALRMYRCSTAVLKHTFSSLVSLDPTVSPRVLLHQQTTGNQQRLLHTMDTRLFKIEIELFINSML